MNKLIKILLVDDDEDDFILTSYLIKSIESWEIDLTWCSSFEQAVDYLKSPSHDLYLFDFLLGAHTGLDLLNEAFRNNCQEPIILLTGRGDQEVAIEALRLGAADYLIKSELEAPILERSIRYALERTSVLKALRYNERRFRKIFDQSGDLLFITDVSGTVVDCNNSARQITEYQREDLLQSRISDVIIDSSLPKYWNRILEGENLQNIEVDFQTLNGKKRVGLLSAYLERNFESPIIQVSINDISARKQTEKEQMFSEKIALTERLVRLLAHEVRNPLTNITLSTEQLESELESDDFQFYTEIIKRNCSRINDLITQLLYSSKPAGSSLLTYSLRKLLDESLNAAKDRLALNRIEVERDYPEEDILLPLDPTAMQLALLNLINNSIEAMEGSQGYLRVGCCISDEYAVVEIEDNGTGISREIISKIFEPYFTGKKSGIGIGLASTLNIVHAHHGTIEVVSELEKGSVFKISLPLAQTE